MPKQLAKTANRRVRPSDEVVISGLVWYSIHMRLPTESEYTELYAQYHTPKHIQRHMAVVAILGQQLANAHHEAGHQVNVDLVYAAGKLHDLVRIQEQWQYLPESILPPLSHTMPHAEMNYLLLRDTYPEMAEVIRSHSLLSITQPDRLTSLESKIVYYADKCVNHDHLVTVEDRMHLGKERWGVTPDNDQSDTLLPLLMDLQTELFSDIAMTPSDLIG